MAAQVGDELAALGNFEMSARLYEMAGKYNLAVKHICILMAQVVHLPTLGGSLRERLGQDAQRFNQLLASDSIDVEPKMKSSFVLLQDLLIFFNFYHDGKFNAALDLLRQTQLVPNTLDDVDVVLGNVKQLSGEVIKVLPDVIVAAMEIAQKQYKQLKAGSGSSLEQTQMQQLRQRAKALSNMAATMPYRLPNDTNKRLIELELDMH